MPIPPPSPTPSSTDHHPHSPSPSHCRTTLSDFASAIFGQDPNWGRIACAAGYAGPKFDVNDLSIELGPTKLMASGQPLPFDAAEASEYLKAKIDARGTVDIRVVVGSGEGFGVAWGCDLSYDYVKINAEYTT